MTAELDAVLATRIRDIADFPKPGVGFKDITPLLGDPDAFRSSSRRSGRRRSRPGRHVVVDKVAGMEARGFILAAPVALALGVGFVPVRKAGKLPFDTHSVDYELEYGAETLQMHTDAVAAGGARAARRRRARDRRHRPRGGRAGRPLRRQVHAVAVLLELSFLTVARRSATRP